MSGALRDLGRLWGQRKESAVRGGEGSAAESDLEAPRASLPLLQVWPSQDSPTTGGDQPLSLPTLDQQANHLNDSRIDSAQASRGGRTVPSQWLLLHPDHARSLRRSSSPEHRSLEEGDPVSPSSSTASSLASVRQLDWERRRSSTLTHRYSLLDALDLEYALLRAAARGSVGPYSLTGSLHKLTFTQSLAFPALARGLASNRRRSYTGPARLDPADSGLNAFAKIVTALVLMLVSVMVFGVVYKFVRT